MAPNQYGVTSVSLDGDPVAFLFSVSQGLTGQLPGRLVVTAVGAGDGMTLWGKTEWMKWGMA